MIAIAIVSLMIFCFGFLIGWGMKSDIRNGIVRGNDVIDEMRSQRANNYVNNPVVKEIREKWPFSIK